MRKSTTVNKGSKGKNSSNIDAVEGGFIENYGGAIAIGYKAGNKNMFLSVSLEEMKSFIDDIECMKVPEIICLCGSARFFKTFDEQNFRLTLEGKIVLSIGFNAKFDEGLNLTQSDKERLDELHKRKIDLCDKVLVLNVGGYIGESTRSEIAYAEKIGRPVYYLETPCNVQED